MPVDSRRISRMSLRAETLSSKSRQSARNRMCTVQDSAAVLQFALVSRKRRISLNIEGLDVQLEDCFSEAQWKWLVLSTDLCVLEWSEVVWSTASKPDSKP